MLVEKTDLTLQFAGRAPVVIAIQEGHVFAAARGQDLEKQPVAVLPEIPRRQDQANEIGIPLLVVDDDLPRRVGGAVFANHDLVRIRQLLSEDAVYGLRDIRSMVVGNQQDADLHIHRVRAPNLGRGDLSSTDDKAARVGHVGVV